ncbi:MAG: hypothetical protein IJL92_01445 [Thermoguttaceae bacterium]|nr:hypothetical protein [Thermoguttaceae bacterium]
MEEEGKEPTLDELYAPPTSTDETRSERPEKRIKWSVGLAMDVVLSASSLVAATLTALLASIGYRNPFNLSPETTDTIISCCGFFCDLNVLLTFLLPFIVVPVRILVLIVKSIRGTAGRESLTFLAYVGTVVLIWAMNLLPD